MSDRIKLSLQQVMVLGVLNGLLKEEARVQNKIYEQRKTLGFDGIEVEDPAEERRQEVEKLKRDLGQAQDNEWRAKDEASRLRRDLEDARTALVNTRKEAESFKAENARHVEQVNKYYLLIEAVKKAQPDLVCPHSQLKLGCQACLYHLKTTHHHGSREGSDP